MSSTKILIPLGSDDYAELAQVFRDVRDGEAAVFEVDDELDGPFVRWLRGQEAAAMSCRDLYLADRLGRVAAAIEDAFARKRRADRAEMDDYAPNPD